jgi:CRISPR-associated protein Cpf1
MKKNIHPSLHDFKNRYSLSKTLRFELRPINENGEVITDSSEIAKIYEDVILKDREIDNAYKALKPVMDQIHEKFINESLESGIAKSIDFSNYERLYKEKSKDIDKEEKELREKIGETFKVGVEKIRGEAPCNEKGKLVLKKNNFKCLTEKGILIYIEKNIDIIGFDFVKYNLSKEDLQKHLEEIKEFFTYFTKYNANRENYYFTKKEQSTAIASRIVHTNLPIFCDNLIQFNSRHEEYKNAEEYCADKFEEIFDINHKIFHIDYFKECLMQKEIEKYNDLLSKYNSLINLYNQASPEKDKNFKKLSQFKILQKQIGCGERKGVF